MFETGSTEKCPTCGIAQANQHSLREAGKCDGKKREAREKAAAEAEKAKKGKAA